MRTIVTLFGDYFYVLCRFKTTLPLNLVYGFMSATQRSEAKYENLRNIVNLKDCVSV